MSYYRQGPFRPGGGGVSLGVPRLTPCVRAIVIACTGVWIAQFMALATTGGRLDLGLYLGLVPASVVRGAFWQPLTYMFLHSPESLFHLLFNMLMVWMFGSELERHWGGRGFLRYYLVAGVGGGLFATAMGFLGGRPEIYTVGASGAVFGLLMAYGLIFGDRTILFMLIFPMKARTMAMVMFVITLFYTMTQPGSGISHVAHLGGAVFGFLYLKRAWQLGALYRELRWKLRRRRFKVMSRDDDFDRWVN